MQADAEMTVEQVKGAAVAMDDHTPAKPAKDTTNNGEEVSTPPKQSQADDAAMSNAEDGEEDSHEAIGLQLYYLLLRALFKELDLYAHPPEAGLLDAKKQMLVYHHAARLFELRTDVLGALHGDFTLTANLPAAFQKVTRKLRKKLQEQGQLEQLSELTDKHVFGHDHAIRFVESNLPAGAKEHCVWLREKPHAVSDHVKSISPFRDVIKFHCFRNPLMLIEDHSMGVVLSVEKVFPVAYLVVSPFLKNPDPLVKSGMKNWQDMEDHLSEHLVKFIGEDGDGWRAFVQRRANIISKGSLTIIQRSLRLNPSKEGLDDTALQKLQDLKDEIEVLREKVGKADEKAAKDYVKEAVSLEGKLTKTEDKMFDIKIVAEKLAADKLRMTKEIEDKMEQHKILEARANTAENAVAEQRSEQENLRLRCSEAEERKAAAVEGHAEAAAAEAVALEANVVMEKAMGNAKQEAELLAGGVHEMMVELQKSKVSKAKAIEQASVAVQEAKTLKGELKKMVSSFEQAKEELVQAAQAAEESAELKEALEVKQSEKVALLTEIAGLCGAIEKVSVKAKEEAKLKEAAACAALEVKTEALEQLTATNVALRTEFAGAKEEAESAAAKQNEALAELKGRDDEIGRLKSDIDELQSTIQMHVSTITMHVDFVNTAKADVEKAYAIEKAALGKKDEAERAAAEMAATVQIKNDEISHLTTSSTALRADLSKQTDALEKEIKRVDELEQSERDLTIQLEFKTRSIETMTADSTLLRVSLISANDKATKAAELMSAAEKVACQAREGETATQAELAKAVEVINEQNATIADLRARPEPSAALLEEMASVRAENASAQAEVEKFRQVAAGAEKLAEEARNREAQSKAEETARSQLKAEETAKLVNECADLRAVAARDSAEAASAKEHATELELAEVNLKATLQFKTDDIERMAGANVKLRTEIITSQQEAEEALARAVKADKEKVQAVSEANRARDGAQAELRGKVAAAESMAAAMGKVRAEAEAARAAEGAAIDVAKRAAADVEGAQQVAREAKRVQGQATAKFQVKAEEATNLTKECSSLRAEAALLREKSEASAAVIKALTGSCEKFKADLAASESKHDWSTLQQPVPDFAPSLEQPEFTLEDVEEALTQVPEEAARALGRRRRSKGPESGPVAGATVEETSASATPIVAALPADTTVGSSRRARSSSAKGASEAPTQKRAKVASADVTVPVPAVAKVVVDPREVLDAD